MVNSAMLLKTINTIDRVIIRKTQFKTTQIVQLDLKTDEVIATYATVREAAEAVGLKKASLASCVSSKVRDISGGFRWRKGEKSLGGLIRQSGTVLAVSS